MLVYQDFEPLSGAVFQVLDPTTGDLYTRLTLTEISKTGYPHPGREIPFSLMFEGPSSEPLDQGTFLLRAEVLGDQAIFLVPVSQRAEIRTYQAIFN